MHTPLCNHAEGTPLQYAQSAVAQGLTGICITDHIPMPEWFDAPWRMRLDQLDMYWEMGLATKEAMQGKLDVRIGLEADYHKGTEGFVERILNRYPWDYVIGSVHYIGAWGFDNPAYQAEFSTRDLNDIYHDYYTQMIAAAHTGLFDSLGHLDLPKVFGHHCQHPLAFKAIEAVAERNMALDYNTAGLRKPVGQAYPETKLVQYAAQLGVPFVLGSDAHKPEHVGWKFAEAVEILGSLGAKITHFKQRQAQNLS